MSLIKQINLVVKLFSWSLGFVFQGLICFLIQVQFAISFEIILKQQASPVIPIISTMAGLLSLSNLLQHHYKAATGNPGMVPNNIKTEQFQNKYKECNHCSSIKIDTTHHCVICDACIIDLDHHCPWINNCVGISNRCHFVLFLFHIWFLCSLIQAVTFMIDKEFVDTINRDNYSPFNFLCTLSLVLSLTMLIFGGQHWLMTLAGYSQLELLDEITGQTLKRKIKNGMVLSDIEQKRLAEDTSIMIILFKIIKCLFNIQSLGKNIEKQFGDKWSILQLFKPFKPKNIIENYIKYLEEVEYTKILDEKNDFLITI